MSNLTLQINSLEALERLIGGDSQVEVEIRNSVVQKFADKHLKVVANSEVLIRSMDNLKTDLQKQIGEQIEKEIGTFKRDWIGGPIYNVKLRPEITSEIDASVRKTVDDVVSKAVLESIKKWASETELAERVQKRVDYYAQEKINQEIKTRLDKIKASF